MQPSKSGVASTYMDVDEAQEATSGGGGGSQQAANGHTESEVERKDEKDENEDNVTEQTHHIIVPSYR